MWPGTMKIIAGDLNAATSRILSLQTKIDDNEIIDVGAVAHVWGARPNQPTCRASDSARPSRLDYILANAEAVPIPMSRRRSSLLQCDRTSGLRFSLSLARQGCARTRGGPARMHTTSWSSL